MMRMLAVVLAATTSHGAPFITVVPSTAGLAAGPAGNSANSCSPQKACDFVKKLGSATSGGMVSLICTAVENCTISGTQLGGEGGLQVAVDMAHVLVQNNEAGAGTLLNIGTGGTVNGTPTVG